MGGAETWLMELLRHWAADGRVQMDLLLTSGERGIFDDEAVKLGARLYYVPYVRRNLPSFIGQFRRILRDGRYDVLHDHSDHKTGWRFLMASGVLPPVRITHVHNPAYQIGENYGTSVSRRLAARIGRHLITHYATNIIGTSRQVVSEYGFDEPQFRRIPKLAIHCGFVTERFLGDHAAAKVALCRELNWPPEARIFLVAGRIDQSADGNHPQTHKNSGFALSVGIECARMDNRVHMLFAGALSPAVPILQQRIGAAGCAQRFKFVGIRRDIHQLMIASDALLFPSRGEGLGMVAVEAQAAGLPVLASTAVPRECVVVPELVRFEPLQRTAAEWAGALLQHASRPRTTVAANQRVAASPFAIENSAGALLELYKQGLRT
jgi:glycosyltransferase involved in cell wall biosynthesis